MGFEQTLFGSGGSLETVPLTKFQKQGRGFVSDRVAETVTFDPMRVAGLGPIEQAGQEQLGQYVRGEAFQDPSQSLFWAGLRRQMKAEEAEGVSAMRRRAQGRGMLYSSPAARGEGRYRADMSNRRMTVLGDLFERERQRDNPLARAQAAAQFGPITRLLEQAQIQSDYDAMMQTKLFPFQTQAPLAQALFGMKADTYMSAPKQGLLSQIREIGDTFGPSMERGGKALAGVGQ